MIVAYNQLSAVRAEARDRSVGLRLGCYDLLHRGHEEGIRFASEQSDLLVVGVASDARTKRLKGPGRPVRPEQSRLTTLDALEGVDYSFIMPSMRIALSQVLWQLKPDVFVEGNEHSRNSLKLGLLDVLGIDYVLDRSEKVDSTTAIIQRSSLAPGHFEHGR